VAAYDAPTGKAGVQRATFVVPPDDGKLRLSSLLLVKRAEKVGEDPKTATPLQYGEMLLYPNLGEPVSKGADKRLAFAVTVYPARGGSPPKLTVEVLQKGRALAQIPAELPAADPKGRVQFMNALPLEALPPGEYELKVTAADGQSSASRSARFDLAP
jgi:hypothetical protein